jgi:hypothetical protein
MTWNILLSTDPVSAKTIQIAAIVAAGLVGGVSTTAAAYYLLAKQDRWWGIVGVLIISMWAAFLTDIVWNLSKPAVLTSGNILVWGVWSAVFGSSSAAYIIDPEVKQ